MSSAKTYLTCIWGASAFYLLCYGITYSSTNALLLFAALASPLAVFLWWAFDRAALEKRITRLEARSEIAAEKRVVMQTGLSQVEHKLEQVETRVTSAENSKVQAEIRG
jgi:hypothetical protein